MSTFGDPPVRQIHIREEALALIKRQHAQDNLNKAKSELTQILDSCPGMEDLINMRPHLLNTDGMTRDEIEECIDAIEFAEMNHII